MGGQYIEVVCPLDHPATEQTPWGRAVAKKAGEGGGWFTWVFSTSDISVIESKFGREAIVGHRTRPDGSDLRWKQIGVSEITDSRELPFFIEWLSSEHPSTDGNPTAKIEQIDIVDPSQLSESWFREEIFAALGTTKINWLNPDANDNLVGISAVHLLTPTGRVLID
jgi:hypothetical protein